MWWGAPMRSPEKLWGLNGVFGGVERFRVPCEDVTRQSAGVHLIFSDDNVDFIRLVAGHMFSKRLSSLQ